MKFWFPNSSGDPITVTKEGLTFHIGDWFTPIADEISYVQVDNVPMTEGWVQRVESIKSKIRKGEIEKEIAHWDFKFKGGSPTSWILSQEGDGRFIIELPDGRLLYGNSPELVLKKNGEHIEVRVLGGTGEWNEKTTKEHSIILSDLVQRFPNRLIPSQTEFVDLGYIKHLKTKLTSTWNYSLDSLVPYIWPNLAIDGKGYGKDYWGTLVGWGDSKIARLWLCIRCGVWDGEFHSFRVGCGITEDSDPQEEWNELINKLGWINQK